MRSLLAVALIGSSAHTAHGQGDILRAGVEARVIIAAPDQGISGFLSDRSVIVGTVRSLHLDTLTLELPRSRGQLVVPLSAVARLDTAWSRRTWYTSAGSGLVRGALLGVLIAPIAGLAAEYAVRGANGTTAVHAGLFTIGLSTAGGAVSGMVARSKLWSRVRLPSGVK